jgi:hypothetical protein
VKGGEEQDVHVAEVCVCYCVEGVLPAAVDNSICFSLLNSRLNKCVTNDVFKSKNVIYDSVFIICLKCDDKDQAKAQRYNEVY